MCSDRAGFSYVVTGFSDVCWGFTPGAAAASAFGPLPSSALPRSSSLTKRKYKHEQLTHLCTLGLFFTRVVFFMTVTIMRRKASQALFHIHSSMWVTFGFCRGSLGLRRVGRPVGAAGSEGRPSRRVWCAPRPQVHSMSSSGTAAEGEAAPAQPASEKEPDMPGPREESEEDAEATWRAQAQLGHLR